MLNDFRHHLYTDFVFGKDAEKSIGKELKRLGATKVLVMHDSGQFLYETGLLENIKGYLKDAGLEVFEIGGVLPNPRISKVREGIELCKKEGVDFLVAIGGGSTMDTCKGVGVGYYYDGDVWELTMDPSKVKKMLPLAVVLTYPATGSESSTSAVFTNDDVTPMIKAGIGSPLERPTIAFENPELTYTLPKYLTACGVADMYIHILERYFSPVEPGCIDYMAEGLLRALLEFGPKVLAEPNNYEYRAEIMWMGTIAHNDTVGVGRPQDWATHGLGHELSALYDTAHGATLTITGPAWMKYVYKHNVPRFARYAREVFKIDEADDEKAALAGIEATKEFYKSLGLPVSFKDAGLPTDQIEFMAERVCGLKPRGAIIPLTSKDALEIYKMCLE